MSVPEPDKNHAPLAVERTLWWARWVGTVVVFVQATIVMLYAEPQPKRHYAVAVTFALGAFIGLANLALYPALYRRGAVTRAQAAAMFAVDAVVLSGLVWTFTDNVNAAVWPLFVILPLEGAYRWQRRGSLLTAVGAGAIYALVFAVASHQFRFPLISTSVTFPALLLLVEAVAVGIITEQHQAERDGLQKLHQSAIALNARLDQELILTTVAREATRILDADFAVVWEVSKEGDRFVPRGAYRLPPGFEESLRLPLSDPVFGEAAATAAYRTRESTWQTGFRSDRGRPYLETIVLPRVWRAVVSVPITHGDQILGVLSCYVRNPRRFDPEEVARIESLAALASVAITNASAYEEKNRALDERLALEKEKDDFVSNVSHELRTPLTAVEGFATTLRRRWDDLADRDRRDFVNRIENQAHSLHGLIRELLDFSRLQAGQPEYRVQELHLAPVIAGIVQRLEHTLSPHPLELDVPDELVCWADSLAFDRILENLLTNAARYSAPEHPITVRASGTQEGDWVDISVTDRGIGITPDELKKVFQRFYRGEADEVRRVRGTGVGLAMVDDLVRAHGGKVWAQSTRGEGSTFTVQLPARPPEPRQEAEPPAVEELRGRAGDGISRTRTSS